MAGIRCGPIKYHLRRNPTQRWHLLRTMATQLVAHERLRTTLHKALALRRVAEKLITYSKNANFKENPGHKIFWERRVQGILTTEEARNKIMNVLAQRFKDQNGGYTKVKKLANRKGDNAQMAYIEYNGNDIAKYEKAVRAEKIKNGEIIDFEGFKKRSFKEERDFFVKKLEEAKEIMKAKTLENEELLKAGKIDKSEFEKRNKIQASVADFFQQKLVRVEHDLWIMNKNKYDLIKFPIYH